MVVTVVSYHVYHFGPSDSHLEKVRLENWKRNFPYKQMYHPTLQYDPSKFQSNVDLDNFTVLINPELLDEVNIKSESFREVVDDHVYLLGFYKNPLIYSKEFERLFHVLGECDRNDNPIHVANIFTHLAFYYRASQHDPEGWVTKEAPVFNKVTGKPEIGQVPLDRKTKWGYVVKSSRRTIASILYEERHWPSKQSMSRKRAWALTDHIINVMYSDRFLSNRGSRLFAYSMNMRETLQPDDRLLVPREGFVESYEAYVRKKHVSANERARKDSLPLIVDKDGMLRVKETGKPYMPMGGTSFLSKEKLQSSPLNN